LDGTANHFSRLSLKGPDLLFAPDSLMPLQLRSRGRDFLLFSLRLKGYLKINVPLQVRRTRKEWKTSRLIDHTRSKETLTLRQLAFLSTWDSGNLDIDQLLRTRSFLHSGTVRIFVSSKTSLTYLVTYCNGFPSGIEGIGAQV